MYLVLKTVSEQECFFARKCFCFERKSYIFAFGSVMKNISCLSGKLVKCPNTHSCGSYLQQT